MANEHSETADPVADEDMFYGGVYWVWHVSGLGLRNATPGECATEIKRLRTAHAELLSALKEVVRISDRKHDAWDRAHAVITKVEGYREQ